MNTTLNRLEICHHAAEPTLIDIEHTSTQSLFTNGLLCLLFRTDEENRFPFLGNAAEKIICLVYLAYRLLKIDDIDAIALGEDIPRHLRVPTPCLMSEVNTCLQKLLH